MKRVTLKESTPSKPRLLLPAKAGVGKGWKKIAIDISTLYRLARMGTTQSEAAAFFCMTLSCFEQRLHADPELREVWDRGVAEAKLSLRRLQLKHAERPGMAGVTMTIHLSKHWLGEHDLPSAITQNKILNQGPVVMSFQFDSPSEKAHASSRE